MILKIWQMLCTWHLVFGIWHVVLETQNLARITLHLNLERCTLHLVPGICKLGICLVGDGCFVLDTNNLAPGIWHVLGICQLGTSLSWRRLLWHHLAFPVAAACTCLIAANWRGIARILLHRLLCIITLRGIALHYAASNRLLCIT